MRGKPGIVSRMAKRRFKIQISKQAKHDLETIRDKDGYDAYEQLVSAISKLAANPTPPESHPIHQEMNRQIRTIPRVLKGIKVTGMGTWCSSSGPQSVFGEGKDVGMECGDYTLELFDYRKEGTMKFPRAGEIFLKKIDFKGARFWIV